METEPRDEEEETLFAVRDEVVELLKQSLPKELFMGKLELVKYQGFWYVADTDLFNSNLMFQRHFRAKDSDLIIATFLKTGTTWLKSLLYSVVNRYNHPLKQSLLHTKHPQELVRRLEHDIYSEAFEYLCPQYLRTLPSPRLFSTHLLYTALPESVKVSRCWILYITRNLLGTLVSMMHFALSSLKKRFGEDFQLPSIEEYFEEFCAGRIVHGPFFDHVVQYWKQNLDQPKKMLFLKYEDLKEDLTLELKRVAEFVGMPFSPSEESEGIIKGIIELCDINNLKELEVNKSGAINKLHDKTSYFRKGEVGDWTNYITPAMAERTKRLLEEKSLK